MTAFLLGSGRGWIGHRGRFVSSDNGTGWRVLRGAEVEAGDFGIVEQIARWTSKPDSSGLHHGAMVGSRKTGARVLLDKQDAAAAFGQTFDGTEDDASRLRVES